MSTEVDSRISPALHPDNVKALPDYDDEIAPILAPTMTAFDAAYQSVQAVYAARAAAEKNPSWTPEARIIQVDGFARKHLDKITRNFDATLSRLNQGIASIEKDLSQPLESKAAASIAAEIRAHVKAMPNEKRHAFIQQALDSGDSVTAASVLGAPSYLSGLDAQFQQVYTRRWHELHNPATVKRLNALKGGATLIEKNAPLIFGELEKAVGAPPHKANKLREAQTAAEKAFVMRDA